MPSIRERLAGLLHRARPDAPKADPEILSRGAAPAGAECLAAVCPACCYIFEQETPLRWVPLCGRHAYKSDDQYYQITVQMVLAANRKAAEAAKKIMHLEFMDYVASIGAKS